MEVWLTADLCACPKCGQPARCWHCERFEDGSVNTYGGTVNLAADHVARCG